ncbi:MAG TPA: amidohydrolase, partial [Thermoanaerobaculia bacterium]
MHSALLIAALAITHVTVIDPMAGTVRRDVNVVVRGDRVESIGGKVPDGAQIVDGRGKFLIPGLWDMHVHLSWTKESALMLLVANGVTGVRDLGGKLGELDEWRTKIATGLIVGPRIVRAGPILNGQ